MCELFVNKVEFFGFVFTENCIKPSQVKSKVCRRCHHQITFIFRYYKLLKSSYAKLFYAYTLFTGTNKEEYSQEYTHKHQTIFDDLKAELISPKVMSYYKPSLNSLIITEASLVGISAILLQQSSNSKYRIIAYPSRTLTNTE